MSRQERCDADREFQRWWDARFIDRAAEPTLETDPDLAAFAQRVHALLEPASDMEGVHTRVWEKIMHATTVQPARVPVGGFRPRLNGRRAHAPAGGHAGRPARTGTPALSWLAGAALVAVVAALTLVVWQARHAAFQPANATPPADVATPAGDWPMPKGNTQRTGATSDAGPTGAFQQLWTFSAAGELNEPVISGDAVYIFGDAGVLYALDRVTGATRWQFDTGAPFSSAYARLPYPQVEGDTIYLGSAVGSVFALAIADGSVRWKASIGAQVASAILVAGGTLYTSTEDGVFLALDPATGAERWRYQGQGFDNTFPAYWNGTVFIGGPSGDILALDAASGSLRWHMQTGGRVRATPIEGGTLFAGSDDGTVYALDAATGAQRWTAPTGASGSVTSPAIARGTVVVGVSGLGLLALDEATGAERWVVDTGTRPDGVTIAPSVAGNAVYGYRADREGVGGLDLATGAEVGFAAAEFSGRPPAVAGGMLYIGSANGTLSAFGSGPPLAPATPGTGDVTPAADTVAPAASPTVAVAPSVSATLLWAVPDNGGMPIEFGPDGNLWVADGVAGGMLVLDRDGNTRASWSAGTGPAPGQLDFKCRDETCWWGGLAFAPDGSLLVAECGNARVQRLTQTGEPIAAWGSAGRGDGQFICPSGIAVAPNGEILVADLQRGDIQRFAADGGFLGPLAGPDGAALRFAGPLALNFDAAGNLLVVELDLRQVRALAPDGSTLLTFGAAGSGDARLVNPMDVTVDEAGNYYVAEQEASRVAVYDRTGAYVGSIAISTPSGERTSALEVAYGGHGALYVEECAGPCHIQKFSVVVTTVS